MNFNNADIVKPTSTTTTTTTTAVQKDFAGLSPNWRWMLEKQ